MTSKSNALELCEEHKESFKRLMSSKNPFRLKLKDIQNKSMLLKLCQPVEGFVEKITSLKALAEAYDHIIASGATEENFSEVALREFNISYEIADNGLDRIPKTGPVVVVANHPFGGIEGVILIDLLKKVRPDVKVLANFLLSRVEELRPNFIFVDPFGSKSSTRKNTQPLRDSIDHLNSGGLLATFPSGTVSHLTMKSRQISDPEWNINIARIIKKSKASVIPLFFDGHNGSLFQIAGLFHPLLRTALLPREMYNKIGKKIGVRVGSVIPWTRLSDFKSDEEVLAYLRLRTYILGSPEHHMRLEKKKNKKVSKAPARKFEEIVPAVDPALMEREIQSLPYEQILVENKDYLVVHAQSTQVPFCLREIGRLREYTFRKVSEGTGKSIDLDGFDNYYIHLFIWNRQNQEIVGAYRIGSVSDILNRYGVSGLYTSTLFAYKSSLLEQLAPALEMGRSFIRPEYQKNYFSLHLLWRGIGTYVFRNPDNKVLFGTVSISNEYNSVSRMLITSFLRGNSYLPEFARLIKPRNPHKSSPLKGVDPSLTSVIVKDLSDVNELIREIEEKHHSIPVLLKQYLRLGGKLLGFNVDHGFGDVLDGLIYVDLTETDPKMLEKYLGKDETVQFLEYHKVKPKA